MARLERPGSDPARMDAIRAYIAALIDGYSGPPLPATMRDSAVNELARIDGEPAPAQPSLAVIVDAADTISLDELRAEEARLERALAFVRGARQGLERLEEQPGPPQSLVNLANVARAYGLHVRAAPQDPPVPPEAVTTTATDDEDPPAPPEPDPAPAGPPTPKPAETVPKIASRATLTLEANGALAEPSTLQGRVLQALAHHGEMTITRLAAKLDLGPDARRQLPATLLRLVNEGEVKAHKPADGRKPDVYSAADPTL
jgi:hypothetical protein